jgi:hypothetical protein
MIEEVFALFGREGAEGGADPPAAPAHIGASNTWKEPPLSDQFIGGGQLGFWDCTVVLSILAGVAEQLRG